MPEGDTIHTLAGRLRGSLAGREIRHVESRWPRLVHGLAGRRVQAVGARGKHLLVLFAGGEVLRVHLGMEGAWRRLPSGHAARHLSDAWALTLRTDAHDHVLLSPRDLERLREAELADHPLLARLGPDLCRPGVDLDEVLRRAADPARQAWPVQDLLLCQEVAAGIGNVYKSEVLFLGRLDPTTPVADVPPDHLRELYATAARLLQANVGTVGRNTTGMRWPALWVYGARDRGCPRCRGPLRHGPQGRHLRVTWWCPRCQRPPGVDAGAPAP